MGNSHIFAFNFVKEHLYLPKCFCTDSNDFSSLLDATIYKNEIIGLKLNIEFYQQRPVLSAEENQIWSNNVTEHTQTVIQPTSTNSKSHIQSIARVQKTEPSKPWRRE